MLFCDVMAELLAPEAYDIGTTTVEVPTIVVVDADGAAGAGIVAEGAEDCATGQTVV